MRLDRIKDEPAINHLEKIASTFHLDLEFLEKYVRFLNLEKKVTVDEVVDKLLFEWIPSHVYQDY